MTNKTRKRIEALEEKVKGIEVDVLRIRCELKGGFLWYHHNPPYCEVKDKRYELAENGIDFIYKKTEQL